MSSQLYESSESRMIMSKTSKIAKKNKQLSDFINEVLETTDDLKVLNFFVENSREYIFNYFSMQGYNFNDNKQSYNYFKFQKDKNIILFLKEQYLSMEITDNPKRLVDKLEKEDLLNEVSNFSFFYQPDFKIILDELIKYGFRFKITKNNLRKDEFIEKRALNKGISDFQIGTNSLIFDKNHPESFYASTRNIPEMIIKMMDYGIKYDIDSPYFEIFNKDIEEIESYFSLKMRRRSKVRKNDIGAIIKYDNNVVFNNMHYRVLKLGQDWQLATDYLKFFWLLGNYIDSYQGSLSIFVSYICRTIPAAVTSAGVMDSHLESNNNGSDDSIKFKQFKPGDELSYKDGDQWRTAEVIKVENIVDVEKKLNPYLRIKVTRPGNEIFENCIPNNLWKDKIRTGGIVTKSRGRSNIVKFNDRISETLEKRYGVEKINKIRISPQLYVNLIGQNVVNNIRSLQQQIQFGDEKGVFMLSDLLYFDNDRESNYVNVHVNNSLSTKKNSNKDSISIFIGAKRGLDFRKFKTSKNIYLTSRIRQHYKEDSELLLNQLKQETNKMLQEQLDETDKIRNYMLTRGVSIPKGVEILVF